MCASLIRTACSPNVKERADCSTSLCDMDGRTLALATHGPAHLGSTLGLVPAILERFPLETLRPGDIFFANDPYIVGVTHLNDCTAAAPIFFDDLPIAFAAAVAHHSDVGGRVPGSESGDSTSIFQEGVRIPPVRLFEAGRRRDDVWELFLLNSRTPHFSEGDLHAQTAALRRGTERVQELYARYGAAAMAEHTTAMLDATERRVRAAIGERLRPGTYRAEDWLDDDGIHRECGPPRGRPHRRRGTPPLRFLGRGGTASERQERAPHPHHGDHLLLREDDGRPRVLHQRRTVPADRGDGAPRVGGQSPLAERGQLAKPHVHDPCRRVDERPRPSGTRSCDGGRRALPGDHPGRARSVTGTLLRRLRDLRRRAGGPVQRRRHGRDPDPYEQHVEPARRSHGNRVPGSGRGIRDGDRHRGRGRVSGRARSAA